MGPGHGHQPCAVITKQVELRAALEGHHALGLEIRRDICQRADQSGRIEFVAGPTVQGELPPSVMRAGHHEKGLVVARIGHGPDAEIAQVPEYGLTELGFSPPLYDRGRIGQRHHQRMPSGPGIAKAEVEGLAVGRRTEPFDIEPFSLGG